MHIHRWKLTLVHGIVWALGLAMAIPHEDLSAEEMTPSKIYVGTYTGSGDQDSKGIYVVDFDASTGELSNARLAGEAGNPSFLTLDDSFQYLYSVAEMRSAAGRSGASLTAWKIGDDGTLTVVDSAETAGDGPCFVGLSPDGKLAGVANYGGGSVALFTIAKDGAPTLIDSVQHTGSSVNPARQGEPHAHAFQFSPDGRFALVADLGTDELMVYDVVDNQKLVRNQSLTVKLTPGHGPRHFAFSPSGKFVVVIEELSSIITVLSYDNGRMKQVEEYSTLPADFDGGNSTAEVQFHPGGKFVYGSNRGHNSLAVFAFDSGTGAMKPLGHVSTAGRTPRNFRLSPDGRWLIAANQETDNLVVFKIGDDGIPQPTGNQIRVARPVCIKYSK